MGRLLVGSALLLGLLVLAHRRGALDPIRESLGEVVVTDCPARVRFAPDDRPFDFEADYYGLRYRGNTGNLIDAHVLFYGAFEKPVLHFLADVASGSGVFIDVGANVGTHSLFMARHAREVHAFEPYPPLVARLRAAIDTNGLRNVVVHEVGLGSEPGWLPFLPPPAKNLGTGSFVRDLELDVKMFPTLEIRVGDEALERLAPGAVEVIKIDVEGFEKPVLKGLARTLARDRPIVVFELTVDPDRPDAFTSGEDLAAAFPDGYRLLRLRAARGGLCSGHYALTEFRFDAADEAVYEVVAYPRERESAIPLKPRI